MGMINLLKETIAKLKQHDRTLDDVLWIGSFEEKISKEQFLKAADVMYDHMSGVQKVAYDLLIVGHDWWLERAEGNDGGEWWEYKKLPIEPEKVLKGDITLVADYGLQYLESLNRKK